MLEQVALTEKLRPSKVEHLILPKRIKRNFKNGIEQNTLLQGSGGTGKTSLAKALVQQFGYSSLYINVSDESSVDVLRTKIKDFCSHADLINQDTGKLVILDEFDGASNQFYKAYRAISEKYHYVKFIATCNYINSVPEPVQSRFNVITFGFTSEEEEKMKPKMAKRVVGIFKKLDINITNEAAKELIDVDFPDFRTVINKIQSFKTRGYTEIGLEDIKKNSAIFAELYQMLLQEPDTVKNYQYIVSNYSTKVDEVLASLGTDFIDWLFNNKDEYSKYLKHVHKIIKIVSEHQTARAHAIDPVVTLLSCIYSIQNELLK